MKEIIVFNPWEARLLRELRQTLQGRSLTAELKQIRNFQDGLERLADSISLYAPITGTDTLGGFSRSLDTLVASLCRKDETEILLHIPTKAILGKSFLIAKINFLYMLLHITGETRLQPHLEQSILPLITDIVFTLMAEEIFHEILLDKHTRIDIKSRAGHLLANLWEYRLDSGVESFAPILHGIWEARSAFTPVYGTLLGTIERFQFSSAVDPACLDILDRIKFTEEERYTFDEFLFGLSFEELRTLQDRMAELGKTAVAEDEIKRILQKDKIYSGDGKNGPREFYSFFLQRKNNARYRKQMNVEGPKKTLEEHVMLYLLEQAQNTP